MENTSKEKEIYYPDLLAVAQHNSIWSDILSSITEHLSTLLDIENDDNENYSILVGIILHQMFDKLLDLKSQIRCLHEDFPKISQSKWDMLQEKFDIFIEQINNDIRNEV